MGPSCDQRPTRLTEGVLEWGIVRLAGAITGPGDPAAGVPGPSNAQVPCGEGSEVP